MKRFIFLLSIFIPVKVFANPILCPVCTLAVGGGLLLARYFGVRDEVIGVWIGAALLALSQWTIYWFETKKWNWLWLKIVTYICWYSVLVPLYLGAHPKIIFNYHKICGVDSFLVSVAAGTLAAIIGVVIYEFLKKKHGGRAHFPYEKVVIPLALIGLTSYAFHFCYKL